MRFRGRLGVGARLLACALLAFGASASHAQDRLQDILGGATTGWPQAPSVSPDLLASQPLAGPVDPREYIVGPGDVFELHFLGSVTRTFTLQVGPEGALYLPGAGAIMVAGQTLESTRHEVLRRLSTEYRGVTMDLRLARPRAMKVFLTGLVRAPGPLTVFAGSHVSDVLVDTLFLEHASRRNIRIQHASGIPSPGGATARADIERFRRMGDRSADPLLRDGDILMVPAAGEVIAIEGAVASPGSYELGLRDSLHTLLQLAGGALPAVAENGLMVRFRSTTEMDSLTFPVANLISGAFNPPLQDGDHVYLYYQPRFHLIERATIFGEVRRPGAYPLDDGHTRLSELVAAAGGFLARADLSTIRVFRASATSQDADPESDRLSKLSRKEMTASEYEVLRARLTSRREDFRVDWTRVRETPALDLIMQDGDVVRVDPAKAAVRVEGEVRRPGLVVYDSRQSVEGYIRLAGGFARHASRGQVRITKAVTGQTLLARDVVSIAPGDLIWVPEKADGTVWQNSQTTILLLAQIATVILALRR